MIVIGYEAENPRLVDCKPLQSDGAEWVTSLAVSRGDSGSPVFNRDGAFVGLVVAARPGKPISYVIPSNRARDICGQVQCVSTPDFPGHRPVRGRTASTTNVPVTGPYNLKVFGFRDFYRDDVIPEWQGLDGFIAAFDRVWRSGFGVRLAVSKSTSSYGHPPENEVDGIRRVADTFLSLSAVRVILDSRRMGVLGFVGTSWVTTDDDLIVTTITPEGDDFDVHTAYQSRFRQSAGLVGGTEVSIRLSDRFRLAGTIEVNYAVRDGLPRTTTRAGVGLGISVW